MQNAARRQPPKVIGRPFSQQLLFSIVLNCHALIEAAAVLSSVLISYHNKQFLCYDEQRISFGNVTGQDYRRAEVYLVTSLPSRGCWHAVVTIVAKKKRNHTIVQKIKAGHKRRLLDS